MTLGQVLAITHEVGFDDPDAIRKLARGTVVLRPHEDGGEIDPGSRLGGRPSLPPSVAWPRRDGRRLAFIAQIDLATQPRIATEQGMPSEGLLLFFYDAVEGPWGFDPKDAGSFAVIYVPPGEKASAIPDWPGDLPEEARYTACRLVSEETVTLPPRESVLIENLNLDSERADRRLPGPAPEGVRRR